MTKNKNFINFIYNTFFFAYTIFCNQKKTQTLLNMRRFRLLMNSFWVFDLDSGKDDSEKADPMLIRPLRSLLRRLLSQLTIFLFELTKKQKTFYQIKNLKNRIKQFIIPRYITISTRIHRVKIPARSGLLVFGVFTLRLAFTPTTLLVCGVE